VPENAVKRFWGKPRCLQTVASFFLFFFLQTKAHTRKKKKQERMRANSRMSTEKQPREESLTLSCGAVRLLSKEKERKHNQRAPEDTDDWKCGNTLQK